MRANNPSIARSVKGTTKIRMRRREGAPKAYAVTLDSKGRMILPKELRELLHVESGDVLYIRPERLGASIRKGINPFDAVAEDAIRQYEAGETMSLDELAKQEGIEFD